MVTSFRNKRNAPTKVPQQLILAWPTSLDPSWFLAYLMTSFLCEARNEGWSKHVAMLGSVRCETPAVVVSSMLSKLGKKVKKQRSREANHYELSLEMDDEDSFDNNIIQAHSLLLLFPLYRIAQASIFFPRSVNWQATFFSQLCRIIG